MDKLRARRGSQLAQAYLLGKFVYILMVEQLANQIAGNKGNSVAGVATGAGAGEAVNKRLGKLEMD